MIMVIVISRPVFINVIANSFEVKGLINASADKDVFAIPVNMATHLKLVPFHKMWEAVIPEPILTSGEFY
jgi:hypothetical protein